MAKVEPLICVVAILNDSFVSYYLRPAQLLLNDGLGHFASNDFETFKTETIEILVTDFNQDGALDAYFVNQKRHDQIAMNDGKGGMTMMPELYGESISWGGASTGDVNGDGYPDVDDDGQLDILITRMTGGNVIYYYE